MATSRASPMPLATPQSSLTTLGNVTGKRDPLNRETLYRYDAKSRLTDVRLPSGATIHCAYDAEDNLTGYVDENGAETSWNISA